MRIGVLTSGGDAPGMNAAIRAVVRKGIYHGLEVVGIRRGYAGLLQGELQPLSLESVADIIQRGGTILRTARSPEFQTAEGPVLAARLLATAGIEALVVIGGDGSFRGAQSLAAQGLRVIGVPATIDNDLGGTEQSIGFDTAVNTVLAAMDRIRDTASSHDRTFIIEVMGHRSGQIALAAGLAGGAESILLPEIPLELTELLDRLRHGWERGKRHSLIVISEGVGRAFELGAQIERQSGLETRVTVLGHLQRGGNPTFVDRQLASLLGAAAVDEILDGGNARMVGSQGGRIEAVDLGAALSAPPFPISVDHYRLAGILAL